MKRTRIVIFATGALLAAAIGAVVATRQVDGTFGGDRTSLSSSELSQPSLDGAADIPSPSPPSVDLLPLAPEDASVADQPDYEDSTPMAPATEQQLTAVRDLFEPAIAEMRPNTQVPVLLPNALPSSVANQPIYIHHEEDASYYNVVLGLTPGCTANVCSLGSVQAMQDGAPYPEEFSETVELTQGIQGYFQPMTCGVSCSPAVVGWNYGTAFYRIYLQVPGSDAEVRAMLVDAANSAIARGAL
jgi:hypothetical protein